VLARSLHGLALLPVLDERATGRAGPVGLALAARDGTACYLPLRHEAGPNLVASRAREWVAHALADPGTPKWASTSRPRSTRWRASDGRSWASSSISTSRPSCATRRATTRSTD
jgi:hypothetical protein